jgi:uracil-DNA glycosylase
MNILDQVKIQLPKNWMNALADELRKDYWNDLNHFLSEQSHHSKVIYPPVEEVFSAFSLTDLGKIRVVILGQDPYHGQDQAHGLCFSIKLGNKVPPSLRNIFAEIQRDLNVPPPDNGFLKEWAKQGVFLLNSVLTVEKSKPNAHSKKGWEKFTDAAISAVNKHCEHIVFMLWGSAAEKKLHLIDDSRHLVLRSTHPSPLSVYRGFNGCGHFSKANKYLSNHGKTPIDWALSTVDVHSDQIDLSF